MGEQEILISTADCIWQDMNIHSADSDPDANLFSRSFPNNCVLYNEDQFNSMMSQKYNKKNIFNSSLIRSIVKNYDKLIHYLSTLNNQFSVIAISETWLSENKKSSGHYEISYTM